MLAGIDAAAPLFPGFKIDTVVIRGVNDDEIVPLMEFAQGARRRDPLHRVHGRGRRHALVDAQWSRGRRCSTTIAGALRTDRAAARSSRRRRPIASGCRTARCSASSPRRPSRSAICDRSRLTADGVWYCACTRRAGVDLRGRCAAASATKRCATDHQRLARAHRPRRRSAARGARPLAADSAEPLTRDPHLEMHTRGG